jgi:hypothetical protein
VLQWGRALRLDGGDDGDGDDGMTLAVWGRGGLLIGTMSDLLFLRTLVTPLFGRVTPVLGLVTAVSICVTPLFPRVTPVLDLLFALFLLCSLSPTF